MFLRNFGTESAQCWFFELLLIRVWLATRKYNVKSHQTNLSQTTRLEAAQKNQRVSKSYLCLILMLKYLSRCSLSPINKTCNIWRSIFPKLHLCEIMPNFIYNDKAFLLEFIFCPNKNQMFPVTGSHVFQKWFPMVSLFVANKNFSVWQFLLGFSLIKDSPRCEPLLLGNKKCGR